jgi:hypothetical protein
MANLPAMDHYPMALELMLNGLKAVLRRTNAQSMQRNSKLRLGLP